MVSRLEVKNAVVVTVLTAGFAWLATKAIGGLFNMIEEGEKLVRRERNNQARFERGFLSGGAPGMGKRS